MNIIVAGAADRNNSVCRKSCLCRCEQFEVASIDKVIVAADIDIRVGILCLSFNTDRILIIFYVYLIYRNGLSITIDCCRLVLLECGKSAVNLDEFKAKVIILSVKNNGVRLGIRIALSVCNNNIICLSFITGIFKCYFNRLLCRTCVCLIR